MVTVRQRRACRIDGSGFYCGMLHEGYTKESSDKMLKVGEVGEELPDGVYAVERVVSSRQRGSVSSVTLHDTHILYHNQSCLPLIVRK